MDGRKPRGLREKAETKARFLGPFVFLIEATVLCSQQFDLIRENNADHEFARVLEKLERSVLRIVLCASDWVQDEIRHLAENRGLFVSPGSADQRRRHCRRKQSQASSAIRKEFPQVQNNPSENASCFGDPESVIRSHRGTDLLLRADRCRFLRRSRGFIPCV